MTYNELTTMAHLESAKQVYGFLCLTAEEGYQITDYVEGEPIERFYASRNRSLLIRKEYARPYRVITDAEALPKQEARNAARTASATPTTAEATESVADSTTEDTTDSATTQSE